MLSEIGQTHRNKYCMIPRLVEFIETEWWFPKAGGRRKWELWFNRHRFSVWEDEKVLGMGGSDHFTTV